MCGNTRRESITRGFHKQQSPIALLLRIMLSSSNIGDLVFDPFAGTGTTLVVAKQLSRRYIGVEIDPKNDEEINKRLETLRNSDSIEKHRRDYLFTENLNKLWSSKNIEIDKGLLFDKTLNEEKKST
ncbi:MAG: DNA methyltransferase [Cuniculiplasma sp.]